MNVCAPGRSSCRGLRDNLEIKNTKNAFITLLAAFLIVAGSPTVWAQAAQQAGDTPKAGSSTTKKDKKPNKTDDAAQSPLETRAASTAPANKSPLAPTAAAPPSTPSSTPASKPATAQQSRPANGAGMVWVNTDSGVYHKLGSRYYGKTKQGKYMTEADAKKAGYRAARKE